MKYKAVFFDVDGTLIPVYSVTRCLRDTFKHFELKSITLKHISQKCLGYKIHESLPILYPGLDEKLKKKIAKYYEKLYLKNYRKYSKLLPYVKSCFKHVKKKGMKIGIVTTKERKRALVILKGFGLKYNVLVSSSDVKNRKPHPEPVLKACKKLKLKPKECIFFGDHMFDMLAGKAAGCTTVGVLTGISKRKELKNAGADFIIDNLKGLKKILK